MTRELCNGTGFYGDNGPGQKGNREYVQCDCTKPMTTPIPELKPAGEWQECIVLTSSLGTDHIIRLNTDWVRRIQANAAAHERYQALTEAAMVINNHRFKGSHDLSSIVSEIEALRDAKGT